MALSDTGKAIGSISRLLKDALTNALVNASPHPNVSVSRPEPASGAGGPGGPRINLFLYEVQLDAAMRNIPLTPGRQSPLWLVLRYVLTGFDEGGESDTDEAHDVLGMGMQVLLGINESGALEQINSGSLQDNPEALKLTFDDGTPDLLSRLMQGPDDRFRMSVPFQIRPVLVATSEPPASMQLVGINYLNDTTIGLAGVQNTLLPSLGPNIDSVKPLQVQLGDVLTVGGTGLGADRLSIRFGSAELAVSMQQPGELQCVIGGPGLDPSRISAGSQPVVVSQSIANGKVLSSNALSASLIPIVTAVAGVGLGPVSVTNPNIFGAINLTGQFLGRAGDYIEVGLLNNSGVALLIDRVDPEFVVPADQTKQQVVIQKTEAVPPGTYTVVFRVNGAQSKQGFLLNMV
jgi:hypothetical protein